MNWILLLVTISGAPVVISGYKTEKECWDAYSNMVSNPPFGTTFTKYNDAWKDARCIQGPASEREANKGTIES